MVNFKFKTKTKTIRYSKRLKWVLVGVYSGSIKKENLEKRINYAPKLRKEEVVYPKEIGLDFWYS
jgi:hypothetical protein